MTNLNTKFTICYLVLSRLYNASMNTGGRMCFTVAMLGLNCEEKKYLESYCTKQGYVWIYDGSYGQSVEFTQKGLEVFCNMDMEDNIIDV